MRLINLRFCILVSGTDAQAHMPPLSHVQLPPHLPDSPTITATLGPLAHSSKEIKSNLIISVILGDNSYRSFPRVNKQNELANFFCHILKYWLYKHTHVRANMGLLGKFPVTCIWRLQVICVNPLILWVWP